MDEVWRILEEWTTYQDYLWFVAVLGWAAVAACAWTWRRFAPPLGDLGIALFLRGLSGVIGAIVELDLLSRDLRTPYLGWDYMMGFNQLLGAWVLFWPATANLSRRARAALILLSSCALLGLGAWRLHAPVLVGLIATGLEVAGVVVLCRVVRGEAGSEAAVSRLRSRLALLPILSVIATHGCWAYAVGQGRATTDFSHFAVPAAAAQAITAFLLGVMLWNWRVTGHSALSLPNASTLRTEVRRTAWLLSIWLVTGMGLTVWSGRIARRAFEENLLHRVAGFAAIFDHDLLDRILAPDLVESLESKINPRGQRVKVARVPRLATPAGHQLIDRFKRLHQANTDLEWIYLGVPLEKELLLLATSADREQAPERRLVLPMLDRSRMTDPRPQPFLSGPCTSVLGALFSAKAPLLHAGDGPPLGWLVAEVSATQWAASFTQAHLQSMALVATGVWLWGLSVAYRVRSAERLEAERSANDARAADQLKSAFLAKVSHELRTPIQSVLGFSELLAQSDLPEPNRSRLSSLRLHGEIMLRLVNDLIDLGALQSGAFRLHPSHTPLKRLLLECTEALRPQAEAKGLHLSLECVSDLPEWVEVDDVRLRQIFLNLLNNAVKFTPRGSVSLHARLLDSPSARRPEGSCGVEFVVCDTGPGIAPELCARLFQPFVRLDPCSEIEGSGLGLALVRGLCTALGGTVELGPTKVGAAFVVKLPLQRTSEPVARGRTHLGAWAGKRILIAEDNSLVRKLLIDFVQQHGATVAAVSDGAAAIAELRAANSHLVLLDIGLPKIDGFEVARAVREQSDSADQPYIIGLSAHAQVEDSVAALGSGMNCFLSKPVSLSDLGEKISRAPGFEGEAKRRPEAIPADLRQQLVLIARAEMRQILAELRAAEHDQQWDRLRKATHYLKNSADVLGLKLLGASCGQLFSLSDREMPLHALGLVTEITQIASDFMSPASWRAEEQPQCSLT